MNEKKIEPFINSRQNISENTRLAYLYDLRAFVTFIDGRELTQTLLNLFQVQLRTLAISSQNRKTTHINHFLKYLYQNGDVDQFYELQVTTQHRFESNQKTEVVALLDFNTSYRKVEKPGDLIMLLILEFGLKPSEIQTLRWADFDWEFKILTVTYRGLTRILPIRDKFSRLVKPIQNADELFSKSRQFLYYELKKSTSLTAIALREQYILQRVAEHVTIYKLAEHLGLKSIHTLDKYYR